MGKSKEIRCTVLYRLLLVAAITAIFVLWAKYTSNIVTLQLPVNLFTGYMLLIAGVIFVCSGIWNLWILDNRLTVIAFLPKRFVKNGIYDFTRHPIFSGAALISFGLSAVTRSASGFWLVSPTFTLMLAAYVAGFENEKTKSVLYTQNYKPFLSLPSTSDIMPSFGDRLSSYFLVFVPWLIIYKAFIFIGAPDDAISTNLPFEEHLPIWEFSTLFYSFAFLFSLLVPLVVKTRKQLRHFITDVWFAIFFVGIIYLVFPLIIEQKDFIPHSILGRIILYERSVDGESGALPSCHVIWAFLAAVYFTRSFVRLKWIWYGLAVLISVSCVTVGAHSIPDVVAGYCTFIIIIYRRNILNYLQQQVERLSNSRKEWRIGRLRIISSGIYAGTAAFTGALLMGFFLCRQYNLAGFSVLMFVIIGVRLFSEFVEKSLQLLRPFIYYSGLIIGIIVCILADLIFSIDFFILLASFIMAVPWVLAIGRLKCLHQAQLYSIVINIVTGLVLIRLFNIGVPSSFIVGICLILQGTGRFVEESFREETRMPYWAGIKISQWIAILSVLSGIIFTTIPNTAVLVFQPNFLSLILATGIGILVTVLFGVDIAESNRHLASRTCN
jgi:membrane-associated phospholipid phosphatase/protein-S-isoprenylcysteine O-methyltransferase Ste14